MKKCKFCSSINLVELSSSTATHYIDNVNSQSGDYNSILTCVDCGKCTVV